MEDLKERLGEACPPGIMESAESHRLQSPVPGCAATVRRPKEAAVLLVPVEEAVSIFSLVSHRHKATDMGCVRALQLLAVT